MVTVRDRLSPISCLSLPIKERGRKKERRQKWSRGDLQLLIKIANLLDKIFPRNRLLYEQIWAKYVIECFFESDCTLVNTTGMSFVALSHLLCSHIPRASASIYS